MLVGYHVCPALSIDIATIICFPQTTDSPLSLSLSLSHVSHSPPSLHFLLLLPLLKLTFFFCGSDRVSWLWIRLFCFLYTMVLDLQFRMWLVWVIYNSAQVLVACRPCVAPSADISVRHHSEPGMVSTLSQAGRTSINCSNLGAVQVQQLGISTEINMQGYEGGTKWTKNFLCRALGRYLLQELASPPGASNDSPFVPASDGNTMDSPPMTLPTLPSDPESPPPPPPRTNPSTLLTPNSHPSGDDGSSTLGNGINKAGKVGISAGVGVSGILLLIVALLYYFKPEIFMCCKTCVRVQVFHHNHPTQK